MLPHSTDDDDDERLVRADTRQGERKYQDRHAVIKQIGANFAASIINVGGNFFVSKFMSGISPEVLQSMGYITPLRSLFAGIPSSMIAAVGIDASNNYGAGNLYLVGENLWHALANSTIIYLPSALVLGTGKYWLPLMVSSTDNSIETVGKYYRLYIVALLPLLMYESTKKILLSSFKFSPVILAKSLESLSYALTTYFIVQSAPSSNRIFDLLNGTYAAELVAILAGLLLFMKFYRPYHEFHFLMPHLSDKNRWIENLKTIVRNSYLFGLMIGSEGVAFLARNIMMGYFTSDIRSAQSIVTQYHISIIGFALALKSANTILIGDAYGNKSIPLLRTRYKFGTLASLLLGFATFIAFNLFGVQLANIFLTNDNPNKEAITPYAVTYFRYAGTFLIFDILNLTQMGTLAGKKETVHPAMKTAFGILCGLLLSWVLGFQTNLGPVGIYLGAIVGAIIITTLLFLSSITSFSEDHLKRELNIPDSVANEIQEHSESEDSSSFLYACNVVNTFFSQKTKPILDAVREKYKGARRFFPLPSMSNANLPRDHTPAPAEPLSL